MCLEPICHFFAASNRPHSVENAGYANWPKVFGCRWLAWSVVVCSSPMAQHCRPALGGLNVLEERCQGMERLVRKVLDFCALPRVDAFCLACLLPVHGSECCDRDAGLQCWFLLMLPQYVTCFRFMLLLWSKLSGPDISPELSEICKILLLNESSWRGLSCLWPAIAR